MRPTRVSSIARAQQLAKTSSISDEEVEARRLAFELSNAKVSEAEARVKEAEAILHCWPDRTARPRWTFSAPRLNRLAPTWPSARTNLDLLTVRAPLKSTVLQVKIRVGEFAAAAVLTNALMVLGVMDPLHIRVEIDESEIHRFRMGAKAYATVRAGLMNTFH